MRNTLAPETKYRFQAWKCWKINENSRVSLAFSGQRITNHHHCSAELQVSLVDTGIVSALRTGGRECGEGMAMVVVCIGIATRCGTSQPPSELPMSSGLSAHPQREDIPHSAYPEHFCPAPTLHPPKNHAMPCQLCNNCVCIPR